MQAVKLLFAAIVAFSLLAEFAESNEAAKYYDQVIYIESLRYRGRWLSAFQGIAKIARFLVPHREI
jgi:hypothetical protein